MSEIVLAKGGGGSLQARVLTLMAGRGVEWRLPVEWKEVVLYGEVLQVDGGLEDTRADGAVVRVGHSRVSLPSTMACWEGTVVLAAGTGFVRMETTALSDWEVRDDGVWGESGIASSMELHGAWTMNGTTASWPPRVRVYDVISWMGIIRAGDGWVFCSNVVDCAAARALKRGGTLMVLMVHRARRSIPDGGRVVTWGNELNYRLVLSGPEEMIQEALAMMDRGRVWRPPND